MTESKTEMILRQCAAEELKEDLAEVIDEYFVSNLSNTSTVDENNEIAASFTSEQTVINQFSFSTNDLNEDNVEREKSLFSQDLTQASLTSDFSKVPEFLTESEIIFNKVHVT